MKIFLFALLLLTCACGEHSNQEAQSELVGNVKAVSPIEVSGVERTNITAVCNALLSKEAILPSALNSRHTFTTDQTDCDGTPIGNGSTEVILQSGLGGFFFKRASDGVDFLFPVVETTRTGVLSDICQRVSDLTNPIVGESSVLFFTTLGASTNDCPSRAGEVCVQIELASLQGDAAVVHTKDWIRVRTSSPDSKYIGFTTHRKKVTRSYCGINEVLTFKANLVTN